MSDLLQRQLSDVALFSEDRAHDVWRRLRREDPVSYHPPFDGLPGFWSITRYNDVLQVSRDPATFISAKGIGLMTDPAEPPASSGEDLMLLRMDGRRHTRMRRLVQGSFTSGMIRHMEHAVSDLAGRLLDRLPRGQPCDFVAEVAGPLPIGMICSMVGVPEADWQLLYDLTNQIVCSADPAYQREGRDAQQTLLHGRTQMLAYFAQLLAERRRAPRGDLTSQLAQAEIDGERLTDQEILFFCHLLVLAGNETTRHAISGGLLALLQHPEQLARLRADRGLLPTAIEEILRFVSPVAHMARMTTREVELGGRRLQPGERVVLWYPSANRDEAVFPRADEFLIDRTPNEHLAFGVGPHFCLGAGLARLELRVVLSALMDRFGEIALAGEVQRSRSTFLLGIREMPVRFAE